MGLKDKSQLKDSFKAGKSVIRNGWYILQIEKDPLKFANSSEFQKIKNRNRKNK